MCHSSLFLTLWKKKEERLEDLAYREHRLVGVLEHRAGEPLTLVERAWALHGEGVADVVVKGDDLEAMRRWVTAAMLNNSKTDLSRTFMVVPDFYFGQA